VAVAGDSVATLPHFFPA